MFGFGTHEYIESNNSAIKFVDQKIHAFSLLLTKGPKQNYSLLINM